MVNATRIVGACLASSFSFCLLASESPKGFHHHQDSSDFSDYSQHMVVANNCNEDSEDLGPSGKEGLLAEKPLERQALGNFVNAVGAVMAATVVVYPLDRAKVLRQIGENPLWQEIVNNLRGQSTGRATYPELMLKGLGRAKAGMTWKNASPALFFVKHKLYKGFTPYSLAMCTAMGINYTVYEELKKSPVMTEQSLVKPALAAGTVSSLIANLASNPLWVYRTLRTVHTPQSSLAKSPFGYLENVKKTPSLAMRGLPMAVPHAVSLGGYFYWFEAAKERRRLARENKQHRQPSSLQRAGEDFLDSAQAKVMVTCLVHPFDSVRINQQQTGEGMWDVVKRFCRHEGGLKRFYFGMVPVTAKNALSTAIHMTIFEGLKRQSTKKPTQE